MRRRLEASKGGLTLYIQGATGDLNPRLNVGNDFENVEILGQEAFEAINEILGNLKPIHIDRLIHDKADVFIPLLGTEGQDKPSKQYRQIARTIGLPPFVADLALDFLYPWRTHLKKIEGSWAFPIQENLLDLGGIKMVSMGMEVFNQIGVKARDLFPGEAVIFSSLTNSCYGYLPTEIEYDLGGYEIEQSWQIYRMPGPMPAHADRLALEGLARLGAVAES